MYINLCSAYFSVIFLNNKSPDIVSPKKFPMLNFYFKLSPNEKGNLGSITTQKLLYRK